MRLGLGKGLIVNMANGGSNACLERCLDGVSHRIAQMKIREVFIECPVVSWVEFPSVEGRYLLETKEKKVLCCLFLVLYFSL